MSGTHVIVYCGEAFECYLENNHWVHVLCKNCLIPITDHRISKVKEL